MSVRHVDGAGAKLDLPGCGCEPRDESDAGSDILGLVGDVLADIGFGEAEFTPVNGAQAEGFEAQLTGDWSRMKGCRQCGYAFFDRSKNRSAAWCAMSICGNRTKNRAYYRRRRASAT